MAVKPGICVGDKIAIAQLPDRRTLYVNHLALSHEGLNKIRKRFGLPPVDAATCEWVENAARTLAATGKIT